MHPAFQAQVNAAIASIKDPEKEVYSEATKINFGRELKITHSGERVVTLEIENSRPAEGPKLGDAKTNQGGSSVLPTGRPQSWGKPTPRG